MTKQWNLICSTFSIIMVMFVLPFKLISNFEPNYSGNELVPVKDYVKLMNSVAQVKKQMMKGGIRKIWNIYQIYLAITLQELFTGRFLRLGLFYK